ncbi:hypothetical protein AB0B25_07295 [Nocardia sp. NPDC049190]|uniref:hypothetical protein n=1 Tax=Nocardia sp. NPDC049190 TaxID=3155650 RepID=UPI00340BEC4B
MIRLGALHGAAAAESGRPMASPDLLREVEGVGGSPICRTELVAALVRATAIATYSRHAESTGLDGICGADAR